MTLLCTLCLPAAAAEGQHARRVLRRASEVLSANTGRQLQQTSGPTNCGDSPSCVAACYISGACAGGGAHAAYPDLAWGDWRMAFLLP